MSDEPLITAIPNIFSYRPARKWDVRTHLTGFETIEKATKRQKANVRFLERYRAYETDLIGKLTTCVKGNRCRLLACKLCLRKARIWYCDQTAPLIAPAPDTWTRFSLIAKDIKFKAGDLNDFKPQRLMDLFRKCVKRAGLSGKIVAFGAIDYSVESTQHVVSTTSTTPLFERMWLPHLYVLTNARGKKLKALRNSLDETFESSINVPRPVDSKAVYSTGSELLKPISYSFKASHNVKFVVLGKRKPGESKGKRKSRKYNLQGREEAELAAFLSRQPLKNHLLLMGLKRVQKSIVETSPGPARRKMPRIPWRIGAYNLNQAIKSWE